MAAPNTTTSRQPVKLYDVFVYNGESIVALRLRLLAPYVDEFIITESWYTYAGEKKPFLWIDRNRDSVFAPYLHKIHFQRIEAFPPMPAAWPHRHFWHNPQDWWPEYYQRDQARVRLNELSGGGCGGGAFVAICSDADEIVRPELAGRLRGMWPEMVAGGEPVYLAMQLFYYNFRWVKRESWTYAFLLTDETCRRCGVADESQSSPALSVLRVHHPRRLVVPNAGWHCSYFMSHADLRRKIRSFAHQEFNKSQFLAASNLRRCLDTGKDLYDRGPREDLVEHDGSGLPDGWREIQAELIAGQEGADEAEEEEDAEARLDRESAAAEIARRYIAARDTRSDINEHLPVHLALSRQCASVVEIGVRSMVSTWGLLHGLQFGGAYTGIDLHLPPAAALAAARDLAVRKGLGFRFIARDDATIAPEEIGPVDMIFIDSLHTYCHLTMELERFAHLARKFLTFHDTSAPWGEVDEPAEGVDRSTYPAWIDREKRGLWPAVTDFLDRHPDEWTLSERRLNNHGFTVLERRKSTTT